MRSCERQKYTHAAPSDLIIFPILSATGGLIVDFPFFATGAYILYMIGIGFVPLYLHSSQMIVLPFYAPWSYTHTASFCMVPVIDKSTDL
jgi:hypothetical protein